MTKYQVSLLLQKHIRKLTTKKVCGRKALAAIIGINHKVILPMLRGERPACKRTLHWLGLSRQMIQLGNGFRVRRYVSLTPAENPHGNAV